MSENKITFKDKEYEIEALSDKAKYFVKQIQDLNNQGMQLRTKIDQVEIATKGFSDLLSLELESKPDESI